MSKNSTTNLMTLFSHYLRRLNRQEELLNLLLAPVARMLSNRTKESFIVTFVRNISMPNVEVKSENSQMMRKTMVTSAKFARENSISMNF